MGVVGQSRSTEPYDRRRADDQRGGREGHEGADRERIISRTLAYVLITTVLVGAYTTLVVVLGGPLAQATGGDTLSVAFSTLAIAALFQPLRRRVQSVLDRRFDRAGYDGQRLADAFAGRLQSEVGIATVSADLHATVREAVGPTTTGLWVRGPIRLRGLGPLASR